MTPSYTFGHPPPDTDALWRCVAQRYSTIIDPDFEIFGVSAPKLELRWYLVRKRTPCGAWIDDRFINLKANKRWACNTEKEAIESFIARKKRQISILETQLKRAKEDLELTNDAFTHS